MNPFLHRSPHSLSLALALGIFGLTAGTSSAASLWTDNFNVADTGSLDGSDQTGRHSGLFANDITLRSSYIQQGIVGQQLNFLLAGGGATGRVRFHQTASINDWFNLGGGALGANILSAGGMRVEFDWIPANNTSDNWIAVDFGISNQAAGEPAFRVNDAGTDIGILFRNNGGSQIFNNGAATTGGNSAASLTTRHVVVDYNFNSFADGSAVTMKASVDGAQVWGAANGVFDWNANGGAFHLELETLENTKIDNIHISSIPEPSSIAITLVGAAGLLSARRRQRSSAAV